MPVSSAHSGLSPMPVQVDMKDAFSRRPTVIDRLHCPCQRIAADPGTDRMVFQILVIRDGMVAREQNQTPAVGQRTELAKHEPNSLRRERMPPC